MKSCFVEFKDGWRVYIFLHFPETSQWEGGTFKSKKTSSSDNIWDRQTNIAINTLFKLQLAYSEEPVLHLL